MKLKHVVLLAVVLCLGGVLIGCSGDKAGSANDDVQTEPNNGSGAEEQPKINTDPAELYMFFNQTFSDEDFRLLVAEPVSKKLPHIKLEYTPSGQGNLAARLTAGQSPDIVYYSAFVYEMFPYDLPMDLRELLRNYPMDLSGYDPYFQDLMKQFGEKDEIYSLPFVSNAYALYYNKDLFDRFGVAYPRDGMTWEELLPVARQLSRTVDGVQYRGLDPLLNGQIHQVGRPLSIRYADAANHRAYIAPQWNRVFQLAMDFYNLPGNKPPTHKNPNDDFVKQKIVGMLPSFHSSMLALLPTVSDLNWDVVQFPSYPEAPGLGIAGEYHGFVISKASKFPEQAMQVIQAVVSDENQKVAARIGRIPTSRNPEVHAELGKDIPAFQGKHMAGILKSRQASQPAVYEHDVLVRNEINAAFRRVFEGKQDINTALREAEEIANQKIIAERAK